SSDLAQHRQVTAVWLARAMALRDLGRPRQAMDAVRRALALERRNPSAWVRLGELQLSLNERREAAAAFRQALSLAPAAAAAHRGLSLAEDLPADSRAVTRMETL